MSKITFSPYAWAKLQYFRDRGETEVGGFGITEPGDLLHVIDFITVEQECTGVTVKFDDIAVADFFEDMVDAGRHPSEFGRIWIHTHPGNSARPSGLDEHTLRECFGKADWVVMFILAKDGDTYARLRHNVGPMTDVLLKPEICYAYSFEGSDENAWEDEYARNVTDLDYEERLRWAQRHERDLKMMEENRVWRAALQKAREEAAAKEPAAKQTGSNRRKRKRNRRKNQDAKAADIFPSRLLHGDEYWEGNQEDKLPAAENDLGFETEKERRNRVIQEAFDAEVIPAPDEIFGAHGDYEEPTDEELARLHEMSDEDFTQAELLETIPTNGDEFNYGDNYWRNGDEYTQDTGVRGLRGEDLGARSITPSI